MSRINAMKEYLINVLIELNKEFGVLNANFLSSEVDNYSLDKIPTKSTIETTITGRRNMKDVYNFRSRNYYGSDVAENLANIGFWEAFEEKIYSNNEQGILPSIDGITKIECLNCGSLQRAGTETCEMGIQIQAEFEKE